MRGDFSQRTSFSLADYKKAFDALPTEFRSAVLTAWGEPHEDRSLDGEAFRFQVNTYGNLYLCLQPERGFKTDKKSGYHDPNLPPSHAYIAFYLWLTRHACIDALIHLGAHGTLEWLPGKAVALSPACSPQALLGPVPVIYPFIVNDPGEAAQAKRRIAAVTLGHNTPPLIETELSPALRETERLTDEYSAAEGFDKKRRDVLAREILASVAKAGLEQACGIKPGLSEKEALMRVDAFLCDVKELSIRDGLHILDDGELDAIVRALDGRFIEPGPSGAPSRGRIDVLPAGRNLYSIDPRTIPTPLAYESGKRIADALVARYTEDNGDWPRSMVLDLWGSQTMRTGGEELAAALALLGVKPVWDYQSFRVSGYEILPLAKLGRPRVDVTLRISGLLRDMFPAQLTLFDAAVQRVAKCDEDAEMNPLRARTFGRESVTRIFGAANGAYGAGVSEKIDSQDWSLRSELGESYLEASGFAYRGEDPGVPNPQSFASQVETADCFLHIQDHRETDILSSLDFAAHEGGFAAAAASLGNDRVELYHADSGGNEKPRMRTLKEECGRIVHGRALSPRWLEGQMRHGFRGAAEMATTVDAAFAYAAAAQTISSEDLDHLYESYLADTKVASFIEEANPAALEAIRRCFDEAMARGIWRPRRNDLSALGRVNAGEDAA